MIEKIIKEIYSIVEEDDAIKKFNEILEAKDEEKIKEFFKETIFKNYFYMCSMCRKQAPYKDMHCIEISFYKDLIVCDNCYQKNKKNNYKKD